MERKIRAKMTCQEVTKTAYGAEKVRMTAVYGGSTNAEDNTFAKATPSGTLELQIDNPEAQGVVTPGSSFYVELAPVPLAVSAN